jgi:pimeloyl-ACP methyl ester carboxylesterase
MAAIQAAALLLLLLTVTHARALAPVNSRHPEAHPQASNPAPPQETGFLNRAIEIHGISYKFQVYIPEELHRPAPLDTPIDDRKPRPKKLESPPIILFLHGRGERGSEGMWQTQIGLAQQLRDHPERWPFIVVMPQCPFRHFWTDPDMLQMAMATLEQEQHEFHADLDRTYLIGLSLGGYGAWELAKDYPRHWAAIAIAASGIFWSYEPDRWHEASTLPTEYARNLGRTPIWLFHGSEDTTVAPRQSELMYEAIKAENGHVRLWDYTGLHHDCWTRAFDEPELPRWLLSHRLSQDVQLPALAERIAVPLHPPALKLPTTILDTYVGEYRDSYNVLTATIQRQGEQVFLKNAQGDINEIMAESTTTFFYPTGSLTRLTFEHDSQGHVTGILYRDDRHEELWEKKK